MNKVFCAYLGCGKPCMENYNFGFQGKMCMEHGDEWQKLSDKLIRELNDEIDTNTIKRYKRGERLIGTNHGYEWVYVVDQNGNQITDDTQLKIILGEHMI